MNMTGQMFSILSMHKINASLKYHEFNVKSLVNGVTCKKIQLIPKFVFPELGHVSSAALQPYIMHLLELLA